MKKTIVYFLKYYKRFVTPVFRQLFGNGCRFEPTCSKYAQTAVNRFGILKGGAVSVKRVLRCHPFTHSSHFDPVPVERFQAPNSTPKMYAFSVNNIKIQIFKILNSI